MALFKSKKPKATAAQQAPTVTTLAQQAMKPPTLPDPDDPNILGGIEAEDRKARKRMGRAATLGSGNAERPKTLASLSGTL